MNQSIIWRTTYLVVHSIEAMRGNYISRMYQSVEGTCTLCKVRIIRIIGSNSVQYKVEAVWKIGNTCTEAIQIESIFYVRSFHLAEHFVSLEATEPLYPRFISPWCWRIIICHGCCYLLLLWVLKIALFVTHELQLILILLIHCNLMQDSRRGKFKLGDFFCFCFFESNESNQYQSNIIQ